MAVNLDFIVVPVIILQANVSDSAKIIYGVIYAFSQLSGGACTASNATLMQIAHIKHERTVQRGLAQLEANNVIARSEDTVGNRKILPLVRFNKLLHKSVKNCGKSVKKG